MYCCPNCFSDTFLNSQIIALSQKNGKCSFCKTENAALVKPEALSDYFNSVFEIYEEVSDGQPLNQLIQNDWALFAFSKSSLQAKLLSAIIQDSELPKKKYAPRFKTNDTIIKEWFSFTEELKHRNRFLPDDAPKIDLFVKFGPLLGMVIKKGSQNFYRARINDEGRHFLLKEMKKPPAKKSLNGRANPVGISYLYVASKPATAIAEMRGHKGETVTLLDFTSTKDLALFDLRDPKNTISPFEWLEEIEFVYKHMPYLALLGDELAKPVIPSKANLDYLSSQYLCEMIKKIGFHGIIYKSSISDGYNYVIFTDNRLKPGTMSQYRITEMSYKSELI